MQDFTVTEVRSLQFGRCFTFNSYYPTTVGDIFSFVFHKGGPEPLVFAHNRGEELSIMVNQWERLKDPTFEEDFKEDYVCIIKLAHDVALKKNSAAQTCKDYGDFEFYDCTRHIITEAIKREKFYCYTYWWKDFFPSFVPECNQDEDIMEIERFTLVLLLHLITSVTNPGRDVALVTNLTVVIS